MLVQAQANFLKYMNGISKRDDGTSRNWHRMSVLDEDANVLNFYLDDETVLSVVQQLKQMDLVILDLSINQGSRGGNFINVAKVVKAR